MKLKEACRKEIDRLIAERIIRKAKCLEFASPTYPILKKSGEIRPFVDFRALNKITLKEASPFPNIWSQIQSIAPSKLFSQIDLKQGYHQIAMDENSIKYTAIVLLDGHYE